MSSFSSSPPAATASPGIITPRRKVQALMARFDEDSEDDVMPSPSKASRVPLRQVDANRVLKTQLLNKKRVDEPRNGIDAQPAKTTVEEDAETEPAIEATTTTALGSVVSNLNDSDDSLSDATGDPATSYQRIRAQMLNEALNAKAWAKSAPAQQQERDAAESSDDEDEDAIVPRGRMAARLQKVPARAPSTGADLSEADGNGITMPTSIESDVASTNGKPTPPKVDSPSSPALQDSSPRPVVTPMKRRRFILRKKARLSSPIRSSAEDDTPKPLDDVDSDQASGEASNARFLALVARKREERLAREAEDEARRRQRLERLAEEIANTSETRLPERDSNPEPMSNKRKGKQPVHRQSGDESEDDDPLSSQILQENSRPTRKASKKALEEMSKETQRISRNMQLAHEARTKKKITKESLLERFNFRTATPTATAAPATSSSVPQSDDEGNRDHQTPPTSPASTYGKCKATETSEHMLDALTPALQAQVNHVEVKDNTLELDASLDALSKPDIASYVKPAADTPLITEDTKPAEKSPKQAHLPRAKATTAKLFSYSRHNEADSDSDLEIVPRERSALLATFERVQPLTRRGVEGKAMKTLRALAHITSPNNKEKSSVTPASLQADLRRKARLQAAQERVEKIQDLQARGIVVRTVQERERDQAEFEDLLEKARKENEELAKKEKFEAKKEARANGEDLMSSDDDEEYEDGEGSGEHEDAELELSGSEDEEGSIDEEEEDSAEPRLVDDQAADISHEESEIEETVEPGSESEGELVAFQRKPRRVARVVEDEDEEETPEAAVQPNLAQMDPVASPDVSKNPFSSIQGLPQNPFAAADSAPMGLTQAFAATMADSQDGDSLVAEQDSLKQLEPIPDPNFLGWEPEFASTATQEDSGLRLDLHLTQSQVQYDTLPVVDPTQLEPPEPTQDMGFRLSSPVGGRFANAPPSTVDTVLVNNASVSPVVRRKGRLQRGIKHTVSDDDELADDEQGSESDGEYGLTADAFNVMKQAARKVKELQEETPFDKKKSEAKDMVEEQAQESEDEYAGIGGASDDDSGGEMDEAVRAMIDEGKVDVDERQLAAFHADKERADDEKAVEKLFKDINNGGLRSKRRAEFDLSDSDDDLEERRRRKRADFARMRKALLADEKVGKIAEDPKKEAFLRAIADRDDGEYEDLVDAEAKAETQGATALELEIPDSQAAGTTTAIAGQKRKRPLEPTTANARRRTHLPSKPLTLSEIRASVSFLTEDPREFRMESTAWSDAASDADHEGVDEHVSTVSRRRQANEVVDRLSLKRGDSLQAPATATARMAFQPAAASSAPGFRLPSLLRRATTDSSLLSDASRASGENSSRSGSSANRNSASASNRSNSEAIKRGASKKCSVNYVARQEARRTQIDSIERRKREGLVNARKKGHGIGVMLGGGTWE